MFFSLSINRFTLSDLISVKKKNDFIKELVDNEGNVITDQKEMANLLNSYFNNIGDDLEKKLPKGDNPLLHVRKDVLNSMFLSLTSHEVIHKLINNLLKKM